MTQPSQSHSRSRSVVARGPGGRPRTYRLVPGPAQEAAYRRLALAILRLDVTSLAADLRAARAGLARAA
jgi:hypothetical protein